MTPGPRQQARAHAESCGEERESVEMGSAGTRRPFCGEGCRVCWSAQQCPRPRKMGMRSRIRSLPGVGLKSASDGGIGKPATTTQDAAIVLTALWTTSISHGFRATWQWCIVPSLLAFLLDSLGSVTLSRQTSGLTYTTPTSKVLSSGRAYISAIIATHCCFLLPATLAAWCPRFIGLSVHARCRPANYFGNHGRTLGQTVHEEKHPPLKALLLISSPQEEGQKGRLF
jgi:hypothetical protein